MEAARDIEVANKVWARLHFPGPAARAPSRHLAVVTCMDSRIDVFAAFGMSNGQAHIIRNAGGLITDDVLRSLALSQRALGTVDVVIVQHTDCGMHQFDHEGFARRLERETGIIPPWDVPGFDDIDQSVRNQVEAVINCPWLPATGGVVGYVYDVETGYLRHVYEAPNRTTS